MSAGIYDCGENCILPVDTVGAAAGELNVAVVCVVFWFAGGGAGEVRVYRSSFRLAPHEPNQNCAKCYVIKSLLH